MDDFEAIVVDNGSADGTREFLEASFPKVRGIYFKERLGFAKAANAGMAAARGEYIALLNNDTEVDPNWLTALKNRLDTVPQIGFCASKLISFDKRGILDGAGDVYLRDGHAQRLGWGLPDSPQFQKSFKIFGACGAASIYRRALLEKTGLLDEDFAMYYEDVDLNFRAQLYGFQCEFVPEAVVYHMGSASSNPKTMFLLARNSVFVIVKNWPAPLLRKNLPRAVAARIKLAWDFLKSNRPLAFSYLKGTFLALLELPSLMRKRRSIQKNARVTPDYIQELFRQSERLYCKPRPE